MSINNASLFHNSQMQKHIAKIGNDSGVHASNHHKHGNNDVSIFSNQGAHNTSLNKTFKDWVK